MRRNEMEVADDGKDAGGWTREEDGGRRREVRADG